MDKRGARLLVKSLIISTFLLFIINSCFAQVKDKDTANFKKDLEKLLLKYGVKTKGYLLNVTSINQKGGQTAFVINNNYYATDSLADSLNIGYKIDESKHMLEVYPIKGLWVQPFVATDSSAATEKMFDHEPFLYAWTALSYIEPGIRTYYLKALISNIARSSVRPIKIALTMQPNEYYLFGDYVAGTKTFLYTSGRIKWVPFKTGD